jgi:hypothetical protein
MNALSPGIDWWYNWYYRPETEVSSVYRDLDIEYVPMRWGAGSAIGVVDAGIPSDSKTLLGFNEPNFGSQANLTATQAAALWPEIEAIADAKGLMLASPATNFCGGDCHDTNPFDYLDDFFAACTDCRVDYIAIHFYVGCDESPGLQNNRAQWLINHIETLKGRFSQPIWLTEFSCSGNPTVADQKAFLEDAVEYLENEPRIMRYAWFAGRADNMTNVDLLGNDGQLTELGQAYVDAPFSQACSY